MKIFEKIKREFTNAILDDNKRYKTQYLCVYSVLGIVSLFMTIVNIIDINTASMNLMLATLIFAVLSFINVAFVYISNTTYKISIALFTVEIIILFSFFLINGSPQGFSAIWSLLLPSLGLVLFGKKHGTIVNVVMLIIIVVLLRTNLGTVFNVYEGYTESFRLRFPFAYVAFYFVGLLIETIRSVTFDNYNYFYRHDNLTGAINRKGFYDALQSKNPKDYSDTIGFIMLDLDRFKSINDSYGHLAGDVVLKTVSKTISSHIEAPLCRWGGEEFVVIFQNGEETERKAHEIRDVVEKLKVNYEGLELHVTVSVGACVVKKEKLNNIVEVSNLADELLYQAKSEGRNIVKFKDYTKGIVL